MVNVTLKVTQCWPSSIMEQPCRIQEGYVVTYGYHDSVFPSCPMFPTSVNSFVSLLSGVSNLLLEGQDFEKLLLLDIFREISLFSFSEMVLLYPIISLMSFIVSCCFCPYHRAFVNYARHFVLVTSSLVLVLLCCYCCALNCRCP